MPKIKDLPLEERPREKLLGYGADKLTETEHKIKIRSFLEAFLEELVLIYEGKKVAPKIPIDEYFISHLRLTVEALTNSYRGTIAEEAEKNRGLKREIAKWFNEQFWSFSGTTEDYAKIARQAAYLLINKVLFYTALQEKFDLDPLEIPKNLRKGDVMEQIPIIESKVERWFVDADVNTCIVILERCDDEKDRKENVVRFVQLKKPLRHFIPKAEKDWDKEVKRLQEIDNLNFRL